jgi:outer membrane cobalamin receptor
MRCALPPRPASALTLRVGRVAAVAAFLSGPGVALAQSNAGDSSTPPASTTADSTGKPKSPVFYDTTTVIARPVSSAAGAVTVLEADEIRASEARSAGELLREVPGLNALSSGGRAGVTNAYVRGGDPNFTLVLLDGIPLNDATELQGGAVNLEELPSELFERAEIVRGPIVSFYGTSSLAGVVQLFTPRGGPGPVRASLGAEAGNASLLHGFGRVAGPAGARGAYSAGLSWDEEEHRVGEDSFRQLDTFATADLPVGSTSALGLTARFANGTQEDYPDASGGPVYGTGDLRHTEHQDLALGARLDVGDPAGARHRLSVGLSRRDLDRTSPAVPPQVPQSVEHTVYTRLRLGWQAPLVRTERTEIDAGLSSDGEWGDNTSVLELPPDFGGDVAGDYHKTRWSGGAYAGLLRQQGPLLCQAALRVDVATTDALQVNPHIGLVWSPGEGATRLRASLGRASKLPSFFALASPRALGGNPDLKPERVLGGEVGLEHSFQRSRLQVGATLFLQEYRDLIDFDFQQFLHVNRSQVRTKGAEMTLRWQPHATLAVQAEAAWVQAVDLAGARLLQEPKWFGGGRVTWQPTPRISLRLHAHAVSHYFDQQLPVPERDTVDGYGLLGLAGSWRVRDGLSLRGRMDNVADRSYETFIGFPGPGRSYWIGLGWERP